MSSLVTTAQRFATGANTLVYRLSGGKLGGRIFGNPILLLNTTGRKTGRSRTTPLLYLPDGENMVIVASNGGAQKHPAWYFNLRSDPEVEVEIGDRKLQVRAQDAEGEEKQGLWKRLVAAYPGYANYQKKTDREIPVVILHPLGENR